MSKEQLTPTELLLAQGHGFNQIEGSKIVFLQSDCKQFRIRQDVDKSSLNNGNPIWIKTRLDEQGTIYWCDTIFMTLEEALTGEVCHIN